MSGYGAIGDSAPSRSSRPSRHDTSGFGAGYQRLDGQNTKDLVDEISSNIFTINNNATTLERSLRQIGTPTDSIQLRDKIHRIEESTNDIIATTTRALKDLGSLSSRSGDRQEKLQCQRLTNEFKDSIRRYNTLQRRVADRVKSTAPLPSDQVPQSGNVDDLIEWGDVRIQNEEERLAREQRKIQMEADTEEIRADVAMLQEREERIRQLEGDILDINEIFRDLGTMVHEQGEVIDSIENNVEQAYDQVEAGNEELRTAARYQRRARKKMCILIVVLVVIAAILGLVIYLSIRK